MCNRNANLKPSRWIAVLMMPFLLSGRAAGAEGSAHWPNFRGPRLDGTAQAAGLPAQWDPATDAVWTTALPGPGSATPAIWGDRIFLNAADRESGTLYALCVNAVDGQVLWAHAHGQNARRGRNDLTAPSPVTDGQVVVFLFGDGNLVAYDFAGRQLWERHLERELGRLSWLFAYGASPLLYEGRLYIQLMRRPEPESYLLALDPATGRELWRQARQGDAQGESHESYITPTVHGAGPDAQIVLAGADAVTGHAAATGRELWRRTFNERRRANWRLVPTPVSDGERVHLALPRGDSLAAVRPGAESGPMEEHAAWTLRPNVPDVCSPLLYDGRLYLVDGDRRVVSCLDPRTGETHWTGRLGSNTVIRSSPTAADGKIYFIDEDGVVFVVAAGDRFELLAQIPMGGGQPARSSVVIAGGRLYVRTADALHCIAGR